MIARKYETIVGLFVVASVAALLVMVVIVARQEGLFQEYVAYRTIFKNISGLKPGSEVHIAGVTAGNVLTTGINADGNIVVTFQVVKKYSDRVRQDSRATIGFMGLLGEKSLDLTPGTQDKAPIAPQGLVVSVEPLDITQLLARAAPGLDDMQKVLTNLVTITGNMAQPGSDFEQIFASVREITAKINAGKGSLGKLVNEPALYRDTAETMGQVRKVVAELEKGKGLAGALINDPALKEEAVKTLKELHASLANFHKTTTDLKDAAARLPDMAKKLDSFLTNLEKAGKGLPGLVTEGQTLFGDADKAAKAAQQSWLLRRYIPQPQERTIRLDAVPEKD